MKLPYLSNTKILAILCFVLPALAVLGAIGIYFQSNPSYTYPRFGGRAALRDEWPKPLVELHDDMERQNAPVKGLDVYSDSDNGYYWKCEATPKLLESMIARWRLKRADKGYKSITTFLNRMPPAFSSLIEHLNEDTVFYVSAGIKPEEIGEGDSYWVMLSPNSHEVIVRYYYLW